MVWKCACSICRNSKIQQHQNFFFLRKSKSLCQFIRIEKIDPTAVNPLIVSCQHHVSCYNTGIFNPGISFSSRICENIILIICYHQNNRCLITAWCCFINCFQSLFRLYYINMLFLKIFCCWSDTSGLQDLIQLFFFHFHVTEFFAGISVFYYF